MIGWCDNDAVLFTPLDTKTPEQTYTFLHLYLPAMTVPHLKHLLSLYPESDFHNTYFPDGTIKLHAETYRLGRIYRDILFTCQPILFGQALNKKGQTVYYYDQNQTMLTPPFHKVGLYGLGVVHTSDLIYVFGNLTKFDVPGWPYHPRPSDYRLRVQQSRSWSLFAATGNPSGEGLNTLHGWKPADFEDENYGTFVIGGPTGGYSGPGGSEAAREVMAAEKLTERCGFLNSPEIVKEIQY
jgi:carboxylesterase type B